MNFNDIFRKNVTYHNLKCHKKPGLLHHPSRKYVFEKTIMGTGLSSNLDDSVTWLIHSDKP